MVGWVQGTPLEVPSNVDWVGVMWVLGYKGVQACKVANVQQRSSHLEWKCSEMKQVEGVERSKGGPTLLVGSVIEVSKGALGNKQAGRSNAGQKSR